MFFYFSLSGKLQYTTVCWAVMWTHTSAIPVRFMAIRSVFEYLLKSINIPLCSTFLVHFPIPFFILLNCFKFFSAIFSFFRHCQFRFPFLFVRIFSLEGYFSSFFILVLVKPSFLHLTHFDMAPKSIQNYLRLFSDTCQKCMPKALQFFLLLCRKWRFKYVHLNLSDAKWQNKQLHNTSLHLVYGIWWCTYLNWFASNIGLSSSYVHTIVVLNNEYYNNPITNNGNNSTTAVYKLLSHDQFE